MAKYNVIWEKRLIDDGDVFFMTKKDITDYVEQFGAIITKAMSQARNKCAWVVEMATNTEGGIDAKIYHIDTVANE